jgi:uncharacterized protein YraI
MIAVGSIAAHIRPVLKIARRMRRSGCRLVAALALLLGMAGLSANAAKAADAITTANVAMRAGPAVAYPHVTVLRAGTPVTVYGCLTDYSWCDTSFGNARGWVAADYLSTPYQGNRVAIPAFGAQLGLAILNFSLNDYWGSYYRNRPWFGRRDYWLRHPPRPNYPHHRPGLGKPPRPRPPVADRPPPRPPISRPPKPRPPASKPPGTKPPKPNPGPGGNKPPGPRPNPPSGGNRPPPGQGNGNGPGSGNKPPRPSTQPAQPQ